jgi:hypothetical protein
MSTALREFLQKHRAEAEAGMETIDQWRVSVQQLFDQIRQWLKESDPDDLIDIEDRQQEIREPGLGRYRVPRLDLHVFGKWIGVIPKACRTVGTAKPPQTSVPQRAEGRVDITDELRRYVLYRFREGGRDVWVIDGLERGYEERTWPGQVQVMPRSEPRPLDQEAFEKALMSYLQ